MDDFQQLATGIGDALRALGSEFTSVWLIVQLGLIVLAGAIGTLVATVLRRRLDIVSLTMGWPPLLRLLTRLLVANIGTVFFVMMVVVTHRVML